MSLSVLLPNISIDIGSFESIESFLETVNRNKKEIALFDEEILGYVCLKRNKNDNDSLSRTIELTASVNSGANSNESYISTSYDDIIIILEEPDIVFEGPVNDYSYVIWKFNLSLTYPRTRILKPLIHISCSMACSTSDKAVGSVSHQGSDIALEDFEPSRNKNFFHGLESDGPCKVSYPEDVQIGHDEPGKGKIESTYVNILNVIVEMPIKVPLSIKLRSAKPAGNNHTLFANFSVEPSSDMIELAQVNEKVTFEILDISLDFGGGNYEDLNSLKFPLSCNINDSLSLIYKFFKIEMSDKDIKTDYGYALKNITLTISCKFSKVAIEEGKWAITNKVITKWSPLIDFGVMAPPINNNLKTSSYSHEPQNSLGNRSSKKSTYRLASSSISPSNSFLGQGPHKRVAVPVSVFNPPSTMTINMTNNNSSLCGLVLTLMGNLSLQLGEVTVWKFQALNNSPNYLNLSLLMQTTSTNKVLLHKNKNLPKPGGTSSFASKMETKEAFLQNRLNLINYYNSHKKKQNGVMILNSDIKIGILEPMKVFEGEIEILGTLSGVYNLSGMMIFDSNTGDGLDIGKLVEVFIV